MLITVVIPVYNEASTILDILKRVNGVELPCKKELVVVDDCSTDGTRQILQAMEAHNEWGARFVYHEKNRGKGAALHSGFAVATGDIIIIQDADLEYDPQEYPKLITPIMDGRADVVYGSRFTGSGPHRVLYFWHFVGNSFLTLLSNMMTNINLTDMETCYKVFTRNVLEKLELKEQRFGFEPEFTAKVARLRCRIYEVGISYSGRKYSEGKKVSWKDGFRALWCIAKYNLITAGS